MLDTFFFTDGNGFKIILDFLSVNDIDTRGKMKVTIRRGEEIFEDFCAVEDKFWIISDGRIFKM